MDERAGQRELLLHAARKLVGAAVLEPSRPTKAGQVGAGPGTLGRPIPRTCAKKRRFSRTVEVTVQAKSLGEIADRGRDSSGCAARSAPSTRPSPRRAAARPPAGEGVRLPRPVRADEPVRLAGSTTRSTPSTRARPRRRPADPDGLDHGVTQRVDVGGHAGLELPVRTSRARSTANTVVFRPSTVWTLRGVNSALSVIWFTVPAERLAGEGVQRPSHGPGRRRPRQAVLWHEDRDVRRSRSPIDEQHGPGDHELAGLDRPGEHGARRPGRPA